jgi:hypothetical protein
MALLCSRELSILGSFWSSIRFFELWFCSIFALHSGVPTFFRVTQVIASIFFLPFLSWRLIQRVPVRRHQATFRPHFIDTPNPRWIQIWFLPSQSHILHWLWSGDAVCCCSCSPIMLSKLCRRGRIQSWSTWFSWCTWPRYLQSCCTSRDLIWIVSSHISVFLRRLFTGQQGGVTIQWICVLQSALIDGIAPM